MKEIEIKIAGKNWQDKIEEAYLKASSKVKIDGFRTGKAPKDLFIKKYGAERLYFEAANEAIEDAYQKMLKEAKGLEIASRPEMELKEVNEKQCVFNFRITLKPEVKLGKYKALGIKKEKVKVTNEEVEHEISHMLEHYAEVVTKDGASKLGDTVLIDFEGFVNDVSFPGGKGEKYSLKLGSNSFIPGFEDQLVGKKANDEVEVKVTFPKDYHAEDLKGKEALFKVLIHEVKETVIPKLDEEFFKDLNLPDVDSEDKLKEKIKENITARKDMEAENKYLDELLKKASENVKCDIPEAMISDEQNRMLEEYAERLRMQGLSLEKFYELTGSNKETILQQMKEEAHKNVLYRLMLEQIAKEEKIEIKDNEVELEIHNMATRYNMSDKDFLEAFGGKEVVIYDMKMRKAMSTLKEEK